MGGILFLFASDFLLLINVGLCMPDRAVQQSKERLIQLDKIRLEGKKGEQGNHLLFIRFSFFSSWLFCLVLLNV